MSGGHRQLHSIGEKFGWRCYHCGNWIKCNKCHPGLPANHTATRDHYIPRSQGGRGGENLVASCFSCNHKKGDGFQGSGPRKRSLGCQFGRSRQQSKTRKAHKPYSFELAVAMVAAVEHTHGVRLKAFECPGCGWWHVRYSTKLNGVKDDRETETVSAAPDGGVRERAD